MFDCPAVGDAIANNSSPRSMRCDPNFPLGDGTAGETMTAISNTDRSVLRRLRQGGDMSRDGRSRHSSGPAILHYGFRPFFLLAALHAALAVPLWLAVYAWGVPLSGPFAGSAWHAHEMIFGYVGAVVAGFILTAIPNWTGRLPLSGMPLAALVALWALGRFASTLIPWPLPAMLLDLAFPAALSFAVWREVTAGRNWRNTPVAVMLSLFGLANLLHHAEGFGIIPEGLGIRLALAAITMLMALIGGRIVPSFTRNWLVKQGATILPREFGQLDKAALLVTAAAVLSWVFVPQEPVAGVALVLAGLLLGAKLMRWAGRKTLREPILVILHLGYGWLAVALVLLGVSIGLPDLEFGGAALHALTAGAIGTMTLAVMTRASLGHTGRTIEADRWTIAIYAAVTLGALLRVAAPLTGDLYLHVLVCGGTLWSAAFLLFAVRYGPILCSPRLSS
jgi:uncharacterized protein involved in response to NO